MSNGSAKSTATQAPFHACEWWLEVTDTVGFGRCKKLFSVEDRTIYRWQADGTTSARSASVLEKMRDLFGDLIKADRIDLARAAIEYLNSIVEDATSGVGIVPLANTMHEEVNRDFLAVGRLAAAINNQEPVAVVRSWGQAVNEEVNRSIAKYERDCAQ